MKEEIVVSMTTWPPRALSAPIAMEAITSQKHSIPVRFVLTVSEDELPMLPPVLFNEMKRMGVEVLVDGGNRRSHKKLMHVIERWTDATVIVVDDDAQQRDGWLQAFIDDHEAHPTDIIYGQSSSIVEIIDGSIVEGLEQRGLHTHPGCVTVNCKPANGSSGTLYPAGTFTDKRFFDRDAYMQLSPTSDETWQWAWAVIARRTFRCLSRCNYPFMIGADQTCALWHENARLYSTIHNTIASRYPEYMTALTERLANK